MSLDYENWGFLGSAAVLAVLKNRFDCTTSPCGAHAAITAYHWHKNIKLTSNKWAIPSFKVFSFKFLKVLFSKMESYANVVKNVHNGKRVSCPASIIN